MTDPCLIRCVTCRVEVPATAPTRYGDQPWAMPVNVMAFVNDHLKAPRHQLVFVRRPIPDVKVSRLLALCRCGQQVELASHNGRCWSPSNELLDHPCQGEHGVFFSGVLPRWRPPSLPGVGPIVDSQR